jgi:hypothetical protein
MSPQQTLEALQNFVQHNAAATLALQWMSPNSQIGIEIGEQLQLTLAHQQGQPQLLEQRAENPAFIVHARPQTVAILVNSSATSVTELSEILLKEYLAGNLSVERVASWLELIGQGYGWLTSFGLSKASQILLHFTGRSRS